MIKITKTLFVQTIIFLLFFTGQGFAKSLPPGSGEGDIPANVLILLDKSGSMSARSTSGSGIDTKRPGRLAVGSTRVNGGYNVLYNSQYSWYDKRNISYDDKLVWKWRQTSPCTYRSQAKVSEFYDGYFYFVGNNGQLCKIHQTTQKTTLIKTYSTRNYSISGGDLHGKYLYIFSNKWRDAKIIIRDLSNNNEKECKYSYKYEKLGDFLSSFYVYYHGDFEINHAGTYMVGYRYDWQKSKRGFYKYNITAGLNCPSETYSEFIPHDLGSYGVIRDMESSTMYNDYFYAANYSQNKITRYDLSDKTLSASDVVHIGKRGKLDASYSPATNKAGRSDVKFKNPISIAPGVNTIYVSDFNNNAIQVFSEESDGINFVKKLGGRVTTTRMQGAHAAIKAITTDANLTSGVHFGFGYWSYTNSVWVYWRTVTQYPSCISIKTKLMNKYGVSKNHWWFSTWGKYRCRDMGGTTGYTGWDAVKKQGKPCNSYSCLKVKVDKDGAARTAVEVVKVSPGGGTDAKQFTKIALDYFKHPTDSPRDPKLSCQVNYIIVIGDGVWSNHSAAVKDIKTLKATYNVKTITIAYGGGINSWGLKNFREAAKAGGTPDVIVANDPASLKSLLSAEINRIIAEKVSFTAPAITATVEEGGSLMQAQFKYIQNQEWQGTLKKSKLTSKGEIAKDSKGNPIVEWEAHKVMPLPASRKIWSVVPGTDYKVDYNNIVTKNSSDISNLFTLFGSAIQDYHSITPNVTGTIGTSRCKNSKLFGPTTNVQDKVDDDTEGLITFIRGLDYFDYDGDCNLTEVRKDINGNRVYLGDIYHSEMIVVGTPNAETNWTSDKEEAFHRADREYTGWATSDAVKNRDQIVYVGANDGMLHAFDYKTGVEKWAFIPPFLLPKMPLIMNTNLNQNNPNKGGTNAIYGVDGSPVQHDIYFKAPGASKKDWHTVLLIPYGRGGKGLSALVVTNPKKPLHLFSIYNDTINHRVHHIGPNGKLVDYEYIASTYNLLSSEEAIKTQENFEDDNQVDGTCNDTKLTACYKSKTYTWENFPASGLTKADFSVEINGKEDKNFTVTNSLNTLTITFGKDVIYQANDQITPGTDSIGIFVNQTSTALGVQGADAIFDYSRLGETWSAPRIVRIPNKGPGDANVADDIVVAVMGAGYGAKYTGVGSGVYVINIEDETNPGKIEKFISIDDNDFDNKIVNSVPGDPVVITADGAKSYVDYRGAIAYVSDLEGKITKINLTNLQETGGLALYDHYTLFDIRATKATGRYMFHSMDSAIGKDTKKLWLFAGTGDYMNLNDTTSKLTKNVMLGFQDPFFPSFQKIPKLPVKPSNMFAGNAPTTLWDLRQCVSTTKDTTGVKCPHKLPPGQKKRGWYIELDKDRKVTASPTVAGGMVYFPIFTPASGGDKCKSGAATICAIDDECGTNMSKLLGKHPKDDDCHYVGTGILSRIVTYAGKLFANIAGKSDSGKDLISKDAIGVEVDITRGTWKENY